jgi:SAM-dependent methyltransferase
VENAFASPSIQAKRSNGDDGLDTGRRPAPGQEDIMLLDTAPLPHLDHDGWRLPAAVRSDGPAGLAVLDDVAASFLALNAAAPRLPTDLLHATASEMHRFSTAVLMCEREGLTREALVPRLRTLRDLHARAPFVARLQSWPRGYAGDFETVEYICDAANRAAHGTVPWAIEECALQSPIAQQHRNKVALQAAAVLRAITRNPRARIASVGCGGCRDLSLVQEYLTDGQGSFVLVDADADALDFAAIRLPLLRDRCELVAGTVPRVLTKLALMERFDLVIAGGLFDYLPDRWAVATLRSMAHLLKPGGRLLFSNIAQGNPFRPWIEYLAEWTLIERSPSDIERLLEAAGMSAGQTVMARDSTSLALVIEVMLGGH